MVQVGEDFETRAKNAASKGVVLEDDGENMMVPFTEPSSQVYGCGGG